MNSSLNVRKYETSKVVGKSGKFKREAVTITSSALKQGSCKCASGSQANSQWALLSTAMGPESSETPDNTNGQADRSHSGTGYSCQLQDCKSALQGAFRRQLLADNAGSAPRGSCDEAVPVWTLSTPQQHRLSLEADLAQLKRHLVLSVRVDVGFLPGQDSCGCQPEYILLGLQHWHCGWGAERHS